MLAAIAGIVFVIAAVMEWVGSGRAILAALIASAIFCFHFGLGYYRSDYRR